MSFNRVLGGMGGVLLLAATVTGSAGCEDAETTGKGGSGGAGGSSAPGGAGGSGGSGGGGPSIQIAGQTAPVSAIYDESGILHLACSTDEDCYAALGYFHAANRFFFMDFVRNLVRGSLGSLVKASLVLDQDYRNRQFFSTTTGDPLEKKLYDDASPAVQGYLDAYTRGVNAWIADMRAGRNDATLTTEYDFELIVKEGIRDWEPADCAAIGLYVLNDLSNNSGDEISLGNTLPAFDPALAADMFSPRPVFDAFTSLQAPAPPPPAPPAPFGWAGLAGKQGLFADAAAYLAAVGSGVRSKMPGDIGSNNWAVGPGRTTNGAALLANDPHLSLTNPSIWFPVEIDAKSNGTGEYHHAGSTFPGLPAIMVGRNENIGWGVTTAYWDLADVYVEEISADGKSVIFNGEEVAFIEKEMEFTDLSSGSTVKKTFRWVPHHGPVIAEDPDTGTAITVRWRGHDGGTDLDAFFALGKAANLAEGKAAVEYGSSANQNFVIVDQAGDIGWYPYSRVPKRAWASQAMPPWLPLPGDGSAEWDGFVSFAQLPQLTNPADGVIATANADMTGASADGDMLNDGQDAIQAFRKADGTREQRILDRIEKGGDAHSMDTMTDIQGDTFSLYGEFVVPLVLAAAENQTLAPEEQDVIDALADWQFTCPTGLDGADPKTAADSADPVETAESIGCTAFHAVFYSIVKEALADEIAASGVPSDGSDLVFVARALRSPASIASGDLLWDDVSTPDNQETRDDILLRAVKFAASRLAVTGEPNTWRWGRFHTISLRSIFDSFSIPTYNAPPQAAPGGLFTVNVASPRRAIPADGKPWDFQFRSGPSVRFVVEASAEGLKMNYQLPGGTDLHRESPFYNNLLPNWLENKPVEFLFGPGAVTSPAVELEVTPAP